MLRFQKCATSTLELNGRKPNLKKHRTEVTEVTEGEEKGAWSLHLAVGALPIPSLDCVLFLFRINAQLSCAI
jgi:hypothetical protein